MSANANAVQPRQVNIPLVVVGAIVVIASFVATVLVGQFFSHPSTAAPTASQAVVVANRDVAPRTTLVAADLTVAHYAVADVPPAALGTTAAAVGLVAQTTLRKGQPVLANQIGKDAGSGALSAYLPLAPGIVALTVPSDEQHGVGGYVQAGDYIDIVAVVTPRGSQTANVRTIYSNIRVIRVGPGAVTAGANAAGAQQTGGLATSLT
ncbi:MAG: Flp pilus assembly protein CpaB, partial [Actinomycetota bacterium]|nr:Flp pilus assembly protein CpaB [Actinomycetota bacterium]